MTRGWLQAAAAVAIFALGAIVGKVVPNVPYFVLDRNVDVVGLAAFCLTLIASLVLYRKLERRKHSDQLAKEATLARLTACIEQLERLENNCFHGCKYTDAAGGCKACRKRFDTFARYAQAVGRPIKDADEKAYHLICAELKDLLTNTPQVDEATKPIWVEDGILFVSPDRRIEVEHHITRGKELLFQLECQVIRDVS